jgi:hypothetical protein
MSSFKEAIRSGLEEYLQGLRKAVEGLTQAELRWQPTLNTYNIGWQVWHMAADAQYQPHRLAGLAHGTG